MVDIDDPIIGTKAKTVPSRKGERVYEQVEEVSTMDRLLNVVRRAKDNILWVEDFLARNPIVPEGETGV